MFFVFFINFYQYIIYFTTYNFIEVEFCRDNVELIVSMLCIATILINVMRIVFIREGDEK